MSFIDYLQVGGSQQVKQLLAGITVTVVVTVHFLWMMGVVDRRWQGRTRGIAATRLLFGQEDKADATRPATEFRFDTAPF
ncbi:MAG: hypothetical protein DWI02_00110 [Planctomycetota bacterium]|jgi:hypothetical protein|nr:MAG: hypothetical protein DWI02_00110 [Planctomycetota bacterium]